MSFAVQLRLVLLALFIGVPCLLRAADPAPFRVIGYLPHYRAGTIDRIPFSHLTDLVYFSIKPQPDGSLDTGRMRLDTVRLLLERANTHGVKVWICVGGWSASDGFAPMSAAKERRQRFVQALTQFCRDHKFAGADIDWEHPHNQKEIDDFNTLLVDLKTAFKAHDLQLSAALPGWGKLLKPDAIAHLDWVNVMAYDHDLPHATFDKSAKDIAHWRDQGVPAAKMILGVPFYGRNAKREALTYADIVRKFSPSPGQDEAGGFHFNGADTLRRKVEYAKAHNLAGVMVWEIGQDLPGEASLLKVIHSSATATKVE